MTAAETTAPLPPVGCGPHRHHHPGDRLTWLYTNDHDQQVRLVGTVTHTNTWTFVVRWDEGHGEARFAHNHEPDLLRRATPTDERDAVTRTTRTAVAHELRRLADIHPDWPAAVRQTLVLRANDYTGGHR